MDNAAHTHTDRHEIKALTGLRGLAAALVVTHHLGLLMLPLGATLLAIPLRQCGLLGMSIFFVLSGFVIHYNYAARINNGGARSIKAFLLARFARLYPLYVIFVGVNYVYNLHCAPNPAMASIFSASLPSYLLGVQSWFYAVIEGYNFSLSQGLANNAWSISTEIFLYLIFIPIAVFWRLSTPSSRHGMALVVGGAIGRIALVELIEHSHISELIGSRFGVASYLSAGDWIVYLSPYGRVFEFIIGMGLAEVWSARSRLPVSARERALLILGAIVCAISLLLVFSGYLCNRPTKGIVDNRVYVVYTIAVPTLIYMLCRLKGRLTALAACPPLLFLGEISYSLYLIHGNVMALFEVRVSGNLMSHLPLLMLRTSLALATTLLLAWLSYRFIELPAKNRILGRDRTIHWPQASNLRQ